MQLETKFLRLQTPVTLGSRFGDWHVTWLGGWGRYRLYYLVMVVKLEPGTPAPRNGSANARRDKQPREARIDADNAEGFKQGAKFEEAARSRQAEGALLK